MTGYTISQSKSRLAVVLEAPVWIPGMNASLPNQNVNKMTLGLKEAVKILVKFLWIFAYISDEKWKWLLVMINYYNESFFFKWKVLKIMLRRRRIILLVTLGLTGFTIFYFLGLVKIKLPNESILIDPNDIAIKLRSNSKQTEYIDNKGKKNSLKPYHIYFIVIYPGWVK